MSYLFIKVLTFIVGVALLIDGSLILFNRGYLEMMRRKYWIKSQADEELAPGKYGYYYDKYRGIQAIMVGLFALFLALFVIGK